jgi:hypothetical protein
MFRQLVRRTRTNVVIGKKINVRTNWNNIIINDKIKEKYNVQQLDNGEIILHYKRFDSEEYKTLVHNNAIILDIWTRLVNETTSDKLKEYLMNEKVINDLKILIAAANVSIDILMNADTFNEEEKHLNMVEIDYLTKAKLLSEKLLKLNTKN